MRLERHAVLGADQPDGPVHLSGDWRAGGVAHARHQHLGDGKGHDGQRREIPVAVHAGPQVHLGDPVEPEPLQDIDQESDLDPVAGEERELLEHLAAAGGLAREWLEHARQFGEEQVEQRARRELGDPAAPRFVPPAPHLERPPVIPFDVADAGVTQQGPQEAVDELGMDVPDVRIHPCDQVAPEDVEALPQRLPLPAVGALVRQDLGVVVRGDAEAAGQGGRAVVGPPVDHHDLIEERDLRHQGPPEDLDLPADRGRFVDRGQPEADRDPLGSLEGEEGLPVAKLPGIERVAREPPVDVRGRPALRARAHAWTAAACRARSGATRSWMMPSQA